MATGKEGKIRHITTTVSRAMTGNGALTTAEVALALPEDLRSYVKALCMGEYLGSPFGLGRYAYQLSSEGTAFFGPDPNSARETIMAWAHSIRGIYAAQHRLASPKDRPNWRHALFYQWSMLAGFLHEFANRADNNPVFEQLRHNPYEAEMLYSAYKSGADMLAQGYQPLGEYPPELVSDQREIELLLQGLRTDAGPPDPEE